METSRRSGIPIPRSGPVHRQGSMESSFSMSNGNLLRISSLTPSPTEEVLQENIALKTEIAAMKKQVVELHRRFEKEQSTRDTFETVQFEQKKVIKKLQTDLDTQSAEYRNILEKNAKFAQRLNEVLPLDDGQPKDMSLIMGTPLSHVESKVFVGNEDFDGALLQVEKLKSYISKLELQIYEMNEKVSELIENSQQQERENKSLKVESENMNRVAKIVTNNMKENMETNKRLEEELRKLKSQNEQLVRQVQSNHLMQQQQHQIQRMSSQIQSHINATTTPASSQMMAEAHQPSLSAPPPIAKKPDHLPPTKRITEMHEQELTQVVENELIHTAELLKYRLEVAEKDLFVAINRAEVAEMALNELRRASRLALNPRDIDCFDYAMAKDKQSIPPPPPPPPPPPSSQLSGQTLNMPKFKLKTRSGANKEESKDAGVTETGKATGMDALISELKHGRVTLRRRQVTQETKNAALKELFEVLEHSQQQNRSSRTFLINHKYNLAQMETDNYQF